jgi:UDP-GlcNAc:undecaprenyl-phosphate GlcNAc-1-phosphate transferase
LKKSIMTGEATAALVETGAGLMVLAFILSLVSCGLARRWAEALGFLDRPGGHKGHATPVPLGGGIAIWLTTLIVLGLGALAVRLGQAQLPHSVAIYISGMWEKSFELAGILGLGTIIMMMGVLDDRYGLPWGWRLGIQCAVAVILVLFFGVRVTLYGPFTHPLIGGFVSALWIVGLTNSFNFLDNMDGLAAGVGLIAALLFTAAQVMVGSLFVPAVLLVLAGALVGFLLHNRAPARLYMGDAGSNFLGFMLGALTVAGTFTRGSYSPYSVLTPLLVMALPLYDTFSVITIRIRSGRSPFQGDRCHFSHRLVERGLTPPQAVWTIYLVTLAGGLGALLLHQLDAIGACVVVAQTLCLLGVVAILEVSARRPEQVHVEAQHPFGRSPETDTPDVKQSAPIG